MTSETHYTDSGTSPPSGLSDAIRKHLFPIADQFKNYESKLKSGKAFHALGEDYLSLWIEVCSKMQGFNPGNCHEIWRSFTRHQDGSGSGPLYFWLAQNGWQGGEVIRHEMPISKRIELLSEGLEEITRSVRNSWKRRALADDLNIALGKPVKTGGIEAALAESIASVREERSKTPRRASSWDAFKKEASESAVVDWLIYKLIAKGDSHLLVAPAKEGKTSTLAALLITALIGAASSSEETTGSILWYSDDQARSKTQSYLLAAAKGVLPNDWEAQLRLLYNQGKLVVDDRFNMTPDGIEELTDEVRKAESPVVVVDSLTSVCRKLGMKENDSSFANVIYDLGEAVKEANPDATLVIIHHATKGGTKEKGALESVRGSGAIVGAVDNIINISKPLKTSRGGNSVVADDDTTEREIRVNGRIPGSTTFIDLEFGMVTKADPERPGKSHEKLDTITVNFKAESNHQEGTEASLGDFQGKLLNHLQTYADQEWTTSMLAAELKKDQAQINRALAKLIAIGKVVKRREGRLVFYQATASLEQRIS